MPIILDKNAAYQWRSDTFRCLKALNACPRCSNIAKDSAERFWINNAHYTDVVTLDHYQNVVLYFLALGGEEHGPAWHQQRQESQHD